MIVQVIIKAETFDKESGWGESYWKEVDLHLESSNDGKVEIKSYGQDFRIRLDPAELQRALRALGLEER